MTHLPHPPSARHEGAAAPAARAGISRSRREEQVVGHQVRVRGGRGPLGGLHRPAVGTTDGETAPAVLYDPETLLSALERRVLPGTAPDAADGTHTH